MTELLDFQMAKGPIQNADGASELNKKTKDGVAQTGNANTTSPVAIITGGASGIGLAVASFLLSKGWHVVISDKNAIAGTRVAAELGAMFFAADTTNYDELSQAFASAWAHYQRLDFVFANAGIIQKESYYDEDPPILTCDGFDSPPLPKFLLTANVNFIGSLLTAYLAQYYLSRNGGGSLIFTASSGALYPSPAVPVYSASKHGILGFAQSIARFSLEEKNIRVNSLCPGAIITSLTDEENWRRFPKAHLTPMKTLLDVVNVLLSDPTINGMAIEISGVNSYFYSHRTPVDESMIVAVNGVQGRAF